MEVFMSHSQSVLCTLSLLAMLTLGGCGGDSSRSTGPTAAVPQTPDTEAARPPAPAASQNPTIKGWVAARDADTVVLALDMYDAQADVFGGYADIKINGESRRVGPIVHLLPGENPNDPEMDLFLYVQAPPGYVVRTGIPVNFTVTVTDRTGHRSNTVSGFFVTETPAGGAVDGPSGPLQVDAKLGRR
jgi:hypothetical protein